MVSVFCTRTASWVRFKPVRRCLTPSHSVSHQKNNNYTFHKTFTIHHPSHTHYQRTDYTEIPRNMNIILYHSPLMNVIPCRQNIYIFLIRDHKPNGEYENYTVKQVLTVHHTQFSHTAVPYGRLLLLYPMADCCYCCTVWQTAAAVPYGRLLLLYRMADCCCCTLWQTASAVPYGRLLLLYPMADCCSKNCPLLNPEDHYCAHATSPEPDEFSRHSHILFTYDPF